MSAGQKWIVIADGGKARIVTGDGNKMHTVQHFDRSGHGDVATDASGGTSQLKAAKADPNEATKDQFARVVAERLNEAVRTGKVDDIVLAAPAHVLHDIREHLNKAAAAKLSKSLSKDLANTPDSELHSHFE